MTRFMIVYVGPVTDPMDMAEDERNAVMAKWAEWMGNVGDAMADIGAPTGPSASVVDDGSEGTPLGITGYTVLEAADMDAAKEMVKDHPFLSDNDGKFSISVHELMPVPEM